MAQSQTCKLRLARLSGKTEEIDVDLSMKVCDFVELIGNKYDLDPAQVKLLCGGKKLKHDMDKSLTQLKVRPGSKVIILNKPKVAAPAVKRNKEEDAKESQALKAEKSSVDEEMKRQEKLKEIQTAAERLAERKNDGFDWTSKHYVELTNQNGEPVYLPENDRKALTMGLTLHEKARALIRRKELEDALHILHLAFESFSQCDKKWLNITDNYGLCALDIVWLYYLKQDEKHLMEAGKWLRIAEFGLKQAHGRGMERVKTMRGGGFMPELALYVRLNILRGIQCCHMGNVPAAQAWLNQAEMDLRKLQVNDMDMGTLLSMNFSEKESRRALRFCNSNVEQAVNHVFAKRAEREERLREEQRRLAERRRARSYGKTSGGRFINVEMLDKLTEIGIFEEIGVETLRQTDNNYEQTMEYCLNPEKKAMIEDSIISRGMKPSNKVNQLTELGFTEGRARAALTVTNRDVDRAVQLLTAPSEAQRVQLDRLETKYAAHILIAAIARQKERELREQQSGQRQLEQDLLDNGQGVDQQYSHEDRLEESNDVDMTENDMFQMQEDTQMVEPAHIDSAAFPNPFDPNTLATEENKDIDMVERFPEIQATQYDDSDQKIDENLLPDLEQTLDDPDAYLDLELEQESQALEQLKLLVLSLGSIDDT